MFRNKLWLMNKASSRVPRADATVSAAVVIVAAPPASPLQLYQEEVVKIQRVDKVVSGGRRSFKSFVVLGDSKGRSASRSQDQAGAQQHR